MDIEDTDRREPIPIDGKFHPINFLFDGTLREGVAPEKYGTYLVQMQLNGEVVVAPTSQMLRRFQRYPIINGDVSGTAWDHIEVMKTAQPDTWHATFQAKIIFSPNGTKTVGIDLRVKKGPGVLSIVDRKVKFIFIPKDVIFV